MDEGQELEEEHSAPSADNPAAPVAAMRRKFSKNVLCEGWRKNRGVYCIQSESDEGFAGVDWRNNPWRF